MICGKEGDSIEQGARLLREAPLYTAARRVSLIKGEAAEKRRRLESLVVSLGEATPVENENGLLYTFPVHESGFENDPSLTLIIANDGLKPRFHLPSEIDPTLLTASPQQVIHLLGPNTRIIHAFGAMDHAGISFAHELRAKTNPESPVPPNLSVLYGSGGLIVTKEGSKDPNVWEHAKNAIAGYLNSSTKEFKLRQGDPNQRGVIFHSGGWSTIRQEEVQRMVESRNLYPECDALVLPQYTLTSDTQDQPLNVSFSELWDRTFSIAFRYQDENEQWRYGFASVPQNLLLSATEMQSLIVQSMEKMGATNFECFCLDLGGNTGFYQRNHPGFYNPSQEVFVGIKSGQLQAPPLFCTTHTCVSAVTFEKR